MTLYNIKIKAKGNFNLEQLSCFRFYQLKKNMELDLNKWRYLDKTYEYTISRNGANSILVSIKLLRKKDIVPHLTSFELLFWLKELLTRIEK